MKKGFTLTELLGVVILLSILLLLLLPNIISSIKSSNKNTDDVLNNIISSATRLYMSDNFSNFIENSNYVYCIPISKLVEDNYLTAPVKYQNIDDITGIKSVRVTYNTKYQFEVVDTATCSTTSYLMIQDQTNNETAKFLGTDLNKNSIEKIITVDNTNIPDNAIKVYDVSELQNDSIKLWYLDFDNNGLYEVYIGQNGGVVANANSKKLFANLTRLESIDLRNLDTSNVINMSSMFLNCINLTQIYINNIITTNVTDMSYMFSNCPKLSSIDLTSLSTEHLIVTDKMFEETLGLTSLNLKNADFSNVESNTLMFKNTTSNINVTIKCSAQTFIYKGLANSGIRYANVTVDNAGSCQLIDPIRPFGGTYVAAQATDTHKGIIYLNPKDLTATCNEALASTNLNHNNPRTPTGINSGCMKFYIYDDSGDYYKLILDHNTTGTIAWITRADFISVGGTQANWDTYKYYNTKGPITVTSKLATDTQGWIGNPRLITANEIAHIVGADNNNTIKWDQNKTYKESVTDATVQVSNIFFDGSGNTYSGWQTQTTNSSIKSRYSWLYDYTYDCANNGCIVSDNNLYSNANIYGYWTSTPTAGTIDRSWYVSRRGYIDGNISDRNDRFGVRPVITILKTDIQ